MTVALTAGRWDPERRPVYFLAQVMNILVQTHEWNTDRLVAVNEVEDANDEALIEHMLGTGRVNLLIDSGIYNLATEHAIAHKMSMDEALGTPIEAIDGFAALFERYTRLALRWQDRAWGLIELDLGGREGKMKTRARLEAMGIRPMPVFHALSDGWDYFDYLAQRYDRICIGNVVNADINLRKRLIATMWERQRAYPKLWMHFLELTPSYATASYPVSSCDSSTWLSAGRWGQLACWAAQQSLWNVGQGWIYDRASDALSERGHIKSSMLGCWDSDLLSRAMRRMVADQRRELGCDALTGPRPKGWPAPRPGTLEG